ncbi:type-F conjugative transfer system mating-pair stabilization protein TraN [Vibrio crassostreae]|uniref:type-F conjugative transfer system mating-pair stabilization protein TraN n=1 Tax=Vibrio crassostreae TaxID=246167 RepID=UPI001B30B7A4|nr:type-F conjugative transfer system mating-pair stabilization protein TraN [Vibrio crassostreae]
MFSCRLPIIILLLWIHGVQAANQEQQYNNNVSWAQSAQQNIPNKANGALTIEDLCADAQCINQVNNPPQKSLNDAAIENQKTSEYYSNDKAGAIQESFDKGRPNIKNDPAFEFALLGQENAYDITHGISNEYVDCDSGTQCITEYIPKQCRKPTNNSVPCTKTPTFTASLSPVIYTCPSGWSRNGMVCKKVTQECRYDSRNYVERSCGDYSFHWQGAGFGFWKSGHSRYRSEQGCGRENGTDYREKYQICGRIEHSQPVKLSCSSGYTLSGGNCVKNTLTWQTQCTLLKECKVVSQTCVEGRSTRTINGVPTTLNCWKYQVNHQCDRPNTCTSLPGNCTTTSSACSLMQNGVCIEQELNKSCPEQNCSATNLICGETSFCLDGDCYGAMPTQNSEFDESAAALAGLNAAGESLGNPPTMFTGKAMKCTDGFFGFADCCKDGGWGTDLGLAQCNEDEKALGQAKEKKLTISLGSYCASKILGACTRKKKTYCVYDSKMARIIQEQGNKNQLGSNFGSAKNPICDPITPEQLQSINFEHIDFTDFYADMHADMDLPNTDEIKNRLESSLKQD